MEEGQQGLAALRQIMALHACPHGATFSGAIGVSAGQINECHMRVGFGESFRGAQG